MRQHRAYRIEVAGLLDGALTDWFEGLTIAPTAAGDSVLTTAPIDQAALRGILAALFDLNLHLCSVQALPHLALPSPSAMDDG